MNAMQILFAKVLRAGIKTVDFAIHLRAVTPVVNESPFDALFGLGRLRVRGQLARMEAIRSWLKSVLTFVEGSKVVAA